MGFFKDMKGTITSSIGGSAAGSGENLLGKTSELAKCSKQIADGRKRMMILYQNIGMKYYSEHHDTQDPQFLDWFGHLDQEIDAIVRAEERIRELKGLVLCPFCGAEIQSDAAFCTSCGNRMPQKTVQEAKTCPSCGTIAAEGALFCTNCGCKLQEKEEKTVQTPDSPRVCACCGAELRANAIFCTACGQRIGEPVQEEPVDRQAFYKQVDEPVQTAEALWDRSSEPKKSELVLDGIEREQNRQELKDYVPELVLDQSSEKEEKKEKICLELDEM